MLQDRKNNKRKLEEVALLGNEKTNFVNSGCCCCPFCLRTIKEIERFYSCPKHEIGTY